VFSQWVAASAVIQFPSRFAVERAKVLPEANSFVDSEKTPSQFPVRFAERNRGFDIPVGIQNPNFAGPKASAGLCIIYCLIFLWEHRLDAGSFKSFPAQAVRSNFNYRH
jgi:hypothetical protein